MQFPKQLRYSQLQAKAFFSYYKQWPIQPIANGGQYFPGQVIRIFLNALMQGVMDPYRSHIQITVQSDIATLPVGLLQVDNSAQSFIHQIVLSSKNRQIQRIIQYGCLAAYLTDIGVSQFYTQGRQTQGLGYSNIGNYEQPTNKTSYGSFSLQSYTDGNGYRPMLANSGCLPTVPPRSQTISSWGAFNSPYSPISGVFRSHVGQFNPAWLSDIKQVYYWYMCTQGSTADCTDNTRTTSLQQYGYVNNIRAEYMTHHLSNDYVDTNTSYLKQEIRLQNGVMNNTFPAKFNNDTQYWSYVPPTLPYCNAMPTSSGNPYSNSMPVPNIAPLFGYSSLFSPNFAKGVWQPFISPTVPQCQMQNGIILNQKIPISRRTFKIPLLSSIIGLLIPHNQFVLIPIKALNDLLIEVTIDPYAMFTSGYNDISQYDNIGMGLMQQRSFKISRIVYNVHTYQFQSVQMDQYLKASLTSGIAINTHFWQLGNQYQIQNSQSITNSWPVACNQQALNQILILFYPMDFQLLSFCRKHFRISNNINKMQLRINMDYYPSQPLSGNGGNPIEIDSTGSNGIFLQQINLSNGYFFSNLSPMHRINAFNFAINQRCYNPYNTHSLYDASMIDDPQYKWGQYSINYDTAMGMSLLHQNRYVGKAAYLFSFQPYAHSKDLLTGLDCRSAKQFDVIFSSTSQNWFPRPQMMLIYIRSSVIIEYGNNGIININR